MKKGKTMPKAADVARQAARKELGRLRLRQVELLTRLSIRLTLVASHVVNKQIPAIQAMSDTGVLMSIGETLLANQTLEGIMGTLDRIAKGAAAAAAPMSDVIPAPETGTRQ